MRPRFASETPVLKTCLDDALCCMTAAVMQSTSPVLTSCKQALPPQICAPVRRYLLFISAEVKHMQPCGEQRGIAVAQTWQICLRDLGLKAARRSCLLKCVKCWNSGSFQAPKSAKDAMQSPSSLISTSSVPACTCSGKPISDTRKLYADTDTERSQPCKRGGVQSYDRVRFNSGAFA